MKQSDRDMQKGLLYMLVKII